MSHLDDFKREQQEAARRAAGAYYPVHNELVRLYYRMIAEIDRRGNDGRQFRHTKRRILVIGGTEYLGWELYSEAWDHRYQLYYLPDVKRLARAWEGEDAQFVTVREISPGEGMTAQRMRDERIVDAELLRDLCNSMGTHLINDFKIPNDPADWHVSTRGSLPTLR